MDRNSREQLLIQYKSLKGTRERIIFLFEHYWNKSKMRKDYSIDTSGYIEKKDLLFEILKECITIHDYYVVNEIMMIVFALSVDNTKEARKIVRKYNAIIREMLPLIYKDFTV
ncbi:MAG: hypothetical protein ACOCRK_11500 [bacterium]